MPEVAYGDGSATTPEELAAFYDRLNHEIVAQPRDIERMVSNSAVFVTARADGKLIGIARGISDGLRGYLTECKLDPAYQGPGAITRTDGRIEHDTEDIASEMARRVLDKMFCDGVRRVDTVCYGTEVDFAEELGFKRSGGLTALKLDAEEWQKLSSQES